MTRRRSPAKTPKEWQKLIQEFDNSGLSLSVFCHLHGINAKTFTNNCYKHRKVLKPAELEPFIEVSKSDIGNCSEIKHQQQSVKLSLLSLEVGDCLLHIPNSIPPAWIAELLREVVR